MSSEPEVFCLYDKSPDSLFDMCVDYIVYNTNIISTVDYRTRLRILNQDVALPAEICEKLLHAYQRKGSINDKIANLFRDKIHTRLRSVVLRNSIVSDQGFRYLMEHKPYELELMHCQYLTQLSLDTINNNSDNLVSLKLRCVTNVLSEEFNLYNCRGYIFDAPKLKRITLHGGSNFTINPVVLVKNWSMLTCLDLSECMGLMSLVGLDQLKNLRSLILHGIHWTSELFNWVSGLQLLRHLDISQSNDRQGKYPQPNEILSKIVLSLQELESLDISGTNLAGSGAAIARNVTSEDPYLECQVQKRCDIPGLVSRVDRPLEFLGLYATHHGACKRHDIPAKVISGDANEEQILTAAVRYMERPAVMTHVLNDLYYLFRYENSAYVGRALTVVLDAMENHVSEKHIQISGSATLFYIVKGKERDRIGIKLKRRIITVLLDGMETHSGDDTMMRNGCLTLCQFKIPVDVLFEYERVVRILLRGVTDVTQEGFVQRIAIYLLNSLACQVDGKQKIFLGNHGAIGKMLTLISDRLERRVCDDVLEVAWSTMWNVTDETPQNCRRFIINHGMKFFLACLKSFPDKEELLRNMMGLLGNVAEVKDLRPCLMNKLFLTVFNELLDSSSDGIEVSYNAAGVLVHIASDGPDAWFVTDLPRSRVMERVSTAINRWDLRAERNINYRSFEPILSLLRAYHTPQCQHWAVWALANLTTVYPEKYCYLVEAEGGLIMLRELVDQPRLQTVIRSLAIMVIENCCAYRSSQVHTGRRSRPPSPDN